MLFTNAGDPPRPRPPTQAQPPPSRVEKPTEPDAARCRKCTTHECLPRMERNGCREVLAGGYVSAWVAGPRIYADRPFSSPSPHIPSPISGCFPISHIKSLSRPSCQAVRPNATLAGIEEEATPAHSDIHRQDRVRPRLHTAASLQIDPLHRDDPSHHLVGPFRPQTSAPPSAKPSQYHIHLSTFSRPLWQDSVPPSPAAGAPVWVNGHPLSPWSTQSHGFWTDIRTLRWVIVPSTSLSTVCVMDSEEPFNKSLVPQDSPVLRRPMGQLGVIIAICHQRCSKPFHSASLHLPPDTFLFGG